MDAKEREQWRMMAAMFAMNGLLSSGSRSNDIAEVSFKLADDMMEQAEQNSGIVSIKKRGKK
jgi:hypothetical protein